MKPIRFLGTARRDLATFPDWRVDKPDTSCLWCKSGVNQQTLSRFRPLDLERMRFAYEVAPVFRVVYVAKFEEAVYVLHAFQKKTRKTSQADIKLAAERYKLTGRHS